MSQNFQAATDKRDRSQDSFTLKLQQTFDLTYPSLLFEVLHTDTSAVELLQLLCCCCCAADAATATIAVVTVAAAVVAVGAATVAVGAAVVAAAIAMAD